MASQPKQFPQPTRLAPADGNFALALIGHAQQIAGFEPGNDFADLIDIHQIGSVRAPEQLAAQRLLQLFQGAEIRRALEVARVEGDHAFVNGRVDDVVGTGQQQPTLHLSNTRGTEPERGVVSCSSRASSRPAETVRASSMWRARSTARAIRSRSNGFRT